MRYAGFVAAGLLGSAVALPAQQVAVDQNSPSGSGAGSRDRTGAAGAGTGSGDVVGSGAGLRAPSSKIPIVPGATQVPGSYPAGAGNRAGAGTGTGPGDVVGSGAGLWPPSSTLPIVPGATHIPGSSPAGPTDADPADADASLIRQIVKKFSSLLQELREVDRGMSGSAGPGAPASTRLPSPFGTPRLPSRPPGVTAKPGVSALTGDSDKPEQDGLQNGVSEGAHRETGPREKREEKGDCGPSGNCDYFPMGGYESTAGQSVAPLPTVTSALQDAFDAVAGNIDANGFLMSMSMPIEILRRANTLEHINGNNVGAGNVPAHAAATSTPEPSTPAPSDQPSKNVLSHSAPPTPTGSGSSVVSGDAHGDSHESHGSGSQDDSHGDSHEGHDGGSQDDSHGSDTNGHGSGPQGGPHGGDANGHGSGPQGGPHGGDANGHGSGPHGGPHGGPGGALGGGDGGNKPTPTGSTVLPSSSPSSTTTPKLIHEAPASGGERRPAAPVLQEEAPGSDPSGEARRPDIHRAN